MVAFFAVPTLLVFALSFRPADTLGGIGAGWTLQTWSHLSNPNYPSIIWRTIWISLAATVICILLALPCAYAMARAPVRWRAILTTLIILPFWTNFLIRVFAWRQLLHPNGPLKQILVSIGIITPDTLLLYNSGAVLLVSVYSFLPFAILPIYAAAEKFDFSLLEAARDLGARSMRAFISVFIPGIRRGLISAALMVFIPALGSYVIPDLVGGPTSELLGNKIAQRTFFDRNLPHASALSALLAAGVLIPLALLALAMRKRPNERGGVGSDRKKS
jgi:spermidine/putrescine transport system permease protein